MLDTLKFMNKSCRFYKSISFQLLVLMASIRNRCSMENPGLITLVNFERA